MRIYLVALVVTLGFIALACVEGSGPVDLTPNGQTPTAGVPVGGETGPLTHRCQGPEFAVFERPTFQDTDSRSSRPLQPLVFCGRVIVEGEAAPDGTLVEAMAAGEICATTRSRGGLYWLQLPLFRCPEKLTAELTFLVEGQPARRVRRLGSVQYVDLIVGQASRSPDLMPVAEAEVAGALLAPQEATTATTPPPPPPEPEPTSQPLAACDQSYPDVCISGPAHQGSPA